MKIINWKQILLFLNGRRKIEKIPLKIDILARYYVRRRVVLVIGIRGK